MKVIQKIQTKSGPDAPVDVQWYHGYSLASAMVAAAMAMEDVEEPDLWYNILSVTITFED